MIGWAICSAFSSAASCPCLEVTWKHLEYIIVFVTSVCFLPSSPETLPHGNPKGSFSVLEVNKF